MTLKRITIIKSFCRLSLLFIFLIFFGCGEEGDSKGSSPSGESDPTFSMPLPKGLWTPASDSDLVMTARAVIDPGTSGARTVDLTVDLTAGRVTGVIDGVPAGPHTVEIQYFVNQVQVATVTLNVDVVPGQNNLVQISPAAIRYVEAVSDVLFVADAADASIKIFDRYSDLPGGVVQASATRTLHGASGASSGSLFVDSIGGLLYFADSQDNSVLIWRNAAAVNGDTPPDRVLKGQATRLLQPTGIAVDPFRNRLYIVNHNGEILIWNDLSSLEGEIPPTAILVGSLVAGDHPVFLDVKSDTLYVANGDEISVFEKLTGDVQNVAPVPTIRIAGKRLSQAGLALDFSQNLLFISSRDSDGTIYRIAESSIASGEVAPAATLAGTETGLNQTSTVMLAGNVLMALNLGGSEIRVWHQADQKNGDASPTQILELDSTSLPTALFYVATQNGERNQTQVVLKVDKTGDGNGIVTSDLPGINCGTTCSALFPMGEIVTLTASVGNGATFTGWSGDCSGASSTCTVMIDDVKDVAANFTTPTSTTTTNRPTTTIITTTSTTTTTTTTRPTTTTTQPTTTTTPSTTSTTVPTTTSTTMTTTTAPPTTTTTTSTTTTTTVPSTTITTTTTTIPSTTTTQQTTTTTTSTTTTAPTTTTSTTPSTTTSTTLPPETFILTVTFDPNGTGEGRVTSDPPGIDCTGSGEATCSAIYTFGTDVMLTATDGLLSDFSGWTAGACTGTDPTCVLEMDSDKSARARFDLVLLPAE
jgi:hypothetical protein